METYTIKTEGGKEDATSTQKPSKNGTTKDRKQKASSKTFEQKNLTQFLHNGINKMVMARPFPNGNWYLAIVMNVSYRDGLRVVTIRLSEPDIDVRVSANSLMTIEDWENKNGMVR